MLKKDEYYVDTKQGEVEQRVWESISDDFDIAKVRKCSCCGESLAIEDFYEGDSTTCNVCLSVMSGKSGDLDMDYSVLKHFKSDELVIMHKEYEDFLDTVDVDLETYLAMYEQFSNFLRYAWWHLGLPEPTEAQLYFCDFLQYTNDHTIVNAFRGIGKSWITSVFVVWKLWRDRTLKILVISASKERADSFSIFTKRLLSELPVVNELIPDGERTSNKAFDVGGIPPAHAPSVKSAGITGQITGSRADIIIADDVEVIDNSATEDAREKLIEKCKDFVSILTPKKTSLILYLGTPQTEESIYDKLSDMGYKKYVIPSRYPDKIEKYKGHLADYITDRLLTDPSLVGKPTDPDRFSDEELMSREMLIGASTFALQFQLDTELSDREKYPLRTGNLICLDLDRHRVASYIAYSSSKHSIIKDIPNLGFSGDRLYNAGYIEEPHVPYQGVVIAIDPSGTGEDETGYAVIAQYLGRLFVLTYGGLTGTGYSDENLAKLATIIKDYGVKRAIIEDNFGDGMYSKMLEPFVRRIAGNCSIDSIKSTTNKEKRIISSLEPIMTQHRLVFNIDSIRKETEWVMEDKVKRQKYSLMYQLTHISKEAGSIKHDDRLDALAMAVKAWEDFLNKDVKRATEEAKQKRLKDELDMMRKIHDKIDKPTVKRRTGRDWILGKGGRFRNGKG